MSKNIIHIGPPKRRDEEISSEIRGLGRTRRLSFRFGGDREPSLLADPFVVALVLPAMQAGLDIEVQAPISRALSEGLEGYQAIFARWFPERFKRVTIRSSGFRESRPSSGAASRSGRGCAFSGGVDSYHALLGSAGADAMWIAGFDTPVNLRSSLADMRTRLERAARESGRSFVSVETNAREWLDSVDWTNAHGPLLIACALFFEQDWSEFVVPSSYRPGTSPPWGTHPDLDWRLSTERLRIVHESGSATRLQKLARVVGHAPAHSSLRVCWIQDLGLRNCGECEKCVRTRIGLEILGDREVFSTFAGHLSRKQIAGLTLRNHQARIFAREMIVGALRHGRLGLAAALGQAFARRWLKRRG